MALTARWDLPAGSGGHGQRRWPLPPRSNHALGVTATVVADGCQHPGSLRHLGSQLLAVAP